MVLFLMRLPGVFAKLLLHGLSVVPHYLQQVYLSAIYKIFTSSKSTKHCCCVWCTVSEQRWNCEALWVDLWNIHRSHLGVLFWQYSNSDFSLCTQKTQTKWKNYCSVSLALITNDTVKKKGSLDGNTHLPRSLFHLHNTDRNGLQYFL